MTIFDEKMARLLADNKIKPLFETPLNFEFADLIPKPDKPTIFWKLIPKIYDSKTKNTSITSQDAILTTLFESKLSAYNLNIQYNSVKAVLDELSKTDQSHCAISMAKNEHRLDNYLFSSAIYVYLKPRIIFLNKNKQLIPPQAIVDGKLNIDQLLTASNNFRLASLANSYAYKNLKNNLSQQQYSRIVNIAEGENKNIISLLYSGRVDALVLWPDELLNFTDESQDSQLLASYEIEEPLGDDITTYIMCNKTETNSDLIVAINKMMKKPEFRNELFSDLLKKLDAQTTAAFMEELNIE